MHGYLENKVNVSAHTKMPLEIWYSLKAMHVMNAHELWLLNNNNSEHLLNIYSYSYFVPYFQKLANHFKEARKL